MLLEPRERPLAVLGEPLLVARAPASRRGEHVAVEGVSSTTRDGWSPGRSAPTGGADGARGMVVSAGAGGPGRERPPRARGRPSGRPALVAAPASSTAPLQVRRCEDLSRIFARGRRRYFSWPASRDLVLEGARRIDHGGGASRRSAAAGERASPPWVAHGGASLTFPLGRSPPSSHANPAGDSPPVRADPQHVQLGITRASASSTAPHAEVGGGGSRSTFGRRARGRPCGT